MKAKYLADIIPPFAAIVIRAMRSDNIPRGYQITAYFKEDDKRVEFIVENLSAKQYWKICADGMMRHNKLKVKKNDLVARISRSKKQSLGNV